MSRRPHAFSLTVLGQEFVMRKCLSLVTHTITIRRAVGAFCLCLVAASSAAASPILINGSLTGPIANGNVPPGWTVLSESPDTMDQNNNVGVPGLLDFGAAPGPSPDGGTWVGFARDGGFIESFEQTVGGFTPGSQYNLSFSGGNFGYAPGGYTGANRIELLINGISAGITSPLALSPNWVPELLTFSASAASLTLGFRLADTTQSYLSIDGIALSDAQQVDVVPEPASLLLFATGTAGLLAKARRRRKRQQVQ
jgi:hypothetical protein